MQHLWTLLVLLAAAINLAPVLGAFAPERMSALYGVNLADPNLQILMRHRAVLFGLVGGLLLVAAFHPPLRSVGYAAGFVSMLSFLLIAWLVGGYSAEIQRVILIDGVGIAALAGAALVHAFWLRTGWAAPRRSTIAPSRALALDLLPELLAVARLDPEPGLPAWVHSSPFVSVTRSAKELSVVCYESVLPPSVPARRGLRCLGVRGPLGFSEVGVLESLARPLAEAGISIFAISTYETDHLLVSSESLEAAVRALSGAGFAVHGWGAAH